MTLTQGMLDGWATRALGLMGSLTETVTYTRKATQDATGTTTTPLAKVERFRKREIDQNPVLTHQRRIRLVRTAVAFEPAVWDEITQASGEVWQIMSIEGGPGQPFWVVTATQTI